MTPLTYYHKQCKNNFISADENQLLALQYFESLYHALLRENKLRSYFFSYFRKPKLVKGLYLWGSVGIGKTFLMDCFYQSLNFKNKQRMHFHQFMRYIHQQIKLHQGKKDPLKIIAKNLSKNCLILCFDEMVVTDIVDAMLMGRLLQMLFAHGVCVVATSNQMPDELYKNGLQRPLFLPAIKKIKQHMHVMHIPTTMDYRLQYLTQATSFYTPNDTLAREAMEKTFFLLTHEADRCELSIEINGRMIPIIKKAHDVIWFDFKMICHPPRNAEDYLAIAEQYSTIFISNIPMFSVEAKNNIVLFIRMIDVFYDRQVHLIFSSEVPITQIYTQGNFLSDFMRTRSRLMEMQSEKYLKSRSRVA